MSEDKHRYFIELQLAAENDLPRRKEAEARRAQAEQFIGHISQWLQENELNDRVASMAVTALGQVLITCEEDVMARIREEEEPNIAAIRYGANLSDSFQRLSGL